MPEKSVIVRLAAVVDAYVNGMNKAKASTEGLVRTSGDLKRLGRELDRLGNSMTRRVTLPILAAGGAAGKLAVDFDDAFRKMAALAGVSANEIDGLKSSVLDLAGDTVRAPQELAEALYFIRSAGIDGAGAMDILDTAARGASAGLGSTAVVADSLTSAINAYGEANITAAQAGDILVAAAREGKVEASELAPQLGRLLPMASQLGVGFDELSGSLAYLSRSGGGAELSATNLQNVLQKLLSPTVEGAKALDAIGMSADDLRASIRDRGLVATLQELRARLEDNGLALSDFSRDAQFTNGVLGLTGHHATELGKVLDATAGSAGDLGAAFEAATAGPGSDMRQAFVDLQVAAIEMGDVLIPIAADIASVIGDIVGVFADLPDAVQVALVAFLGLAAAVGPIMKVHGAVKNLNTLVSSARQAIASRGGLGEVIKSVGPAAGIATAALTVGTAALMSYMEQKRKAAERVRAFTEAMEADNGVIGENTEALIRNQLQQSGLIDDLADAGIAIETVNKALAGNRDANNEVEAALGGLVSRAVWDKVAAGAAGARDKVADANKVFGETKDVVPPVTAVIGEFGGKVADEAVAADAAAAATQRHNDAIKALGDTLKAQFDPLFKMADAVDDNAVAQDRLNELQASGEATERDLAEAHREVARTALDVHTASIDLAAAVRDGSVSVEDARHTLGRWVGQGLITQEQAENVAGQFVNVATRADELNGRNVEMAVTAADYATPVIDRIAATISRLRTRYHLQVTASGDLRVMQRWGGVVPAQQGLLTAGIVKQPTVVFGERATGGEAYIPRLGNYDRSMGILSQAADWYGADVVPRGASWGMAGGATSVSLSFAPVIQIGDPVTGRRVFDEMARDIRMNGIPRPIKEALKQAVA